MHRGISLTVALPARLCPPPYDRDTTGTAILAYTSTDPSEIGLLVTSSTGGTGRWRLPRRLLLEGLVWPAATGAVQVWSTTWDPDGSVWVALPQPAGRLTLGLPRVRVVEYVLDVFAAVPLVTGR